MPHPFSAHLRPVVSCPPSLLCHLSFLPPSSYSWCGNSLLFPACHLAGAVGRAFVIPSGRQPITPAYTLGSRWTRSLLGSRMPSLVDPWIEWPCCGDPVCVHTTMEQKSTAISAPGGKPTERGLPALHMPGPWPPGGLPLGASLTPMHL